jgi:hypothetical protein
MGVDINAIAYHYAFLSPANSIFGCCSYRADTRAYANHERILTRSIHRRGILLSLAGGEFPDSLISFEMPEVVQIAISHNTSLRL